jgi:hypothetical protein
MSDFSSTHLETVRKIALSFPGVEEAETFGSPNWRVKKGMLACPAGHVKEDNVLALKVGTMESEFLIEAEPDIYYVTDHYRSWGGVLVRMDSISAATFRHIFEKAWRRLANKRDLATYETKKAV